MDTVPISQGGVQLAVMDTVLIPEAGTQLVAIPETDAPRAYATRSARQMARDV